MTRLTRASANKTPPKASLRQEFDSLSDDTMLSIREVAELLGLSRWTVKAWRHVGRGPQPTKLGRSLRFSAGDVRAWLAACRRAS